MFVITVDPKLKGLVQGYIWSRYIAFNLLTGFFTIQRSSSWADNEVIAVIASDITTSNIEICVYSGIRRVSQDKW